MAVADDFSLIQYRNNYLVFSQMINGVNQQPVDEAFPNEQINFDDYELQLQFSFLVPLATDIFGSSVSFYTAYTNRSFWQLFNYKESRPFRETNHEPELWFSYFYDLKWGDLNAPMIWLGVRHQSNGQYTSLSRGWNRVYIKAFFDYKHWSFSVIHWDRLEKLSAPEDVVFDYEKFIGNGELEFTYSFSRNDIGLKYAYSFSGSEYGSITLDFSYPISNTIALYVLYFNGYGESLIDLEYDAETISVGFKLDDW